MTDRMKQWASEDIKSLFELANKQIAKATPSQRTAADAKSIEAAARLRDMITIFNKIHGRNIGRFIVTGGSNLKSLCERCTGTFIQFRGRRGCGDIQLYAINEIQMNNLKAAIRIYQ